MLAALKFLWEGFVFLFAYWVLIILVGLVLS